MSVIDKVRNIFKKDDAGKQPSSPLRNSGAPKIWTMPPAMQKEFEKGVRYNMKVVIRGIRRTGKSSLLARLHGHAFPEVYAPSPEISAATIRFQSSDMPEDHGVKVELWDVVDSGIVTPAAGSSSAAASSSAASSLFASGKKGSATEPLTLVADASTIDVYRGCQCVIFLVDPLRKESLEYVVHEAKHVPGTCAILVALNFMDVPKHQHIVTERDVDAACRQLSRSSTPMIFLASQGAAPERTLSASASWVSISARTGYGLSVLQSFFEIPVSFVHLAALETQMKGIYHKIEQHQAWMLSERARLNYEERERSREPVKSEVAGDVQVTAPTKQLPPQQAATPAATAQPKPVVRGETVLITLPSAKKPAVAQPAAAPKKTPNEDSGTIANDFFGDLSDDDDGKASSSSDDSDSDAAPPASPPSTSTRSKSIVGRRSGADDSEHVPRPAPAAAQAPVTVPPPTAVISPIVAVEVSKPLQTFRAAPLASTAALRTEAADKLLVKDLDVGMSGSKVDDDFFNSDESDADADDDPTKNDDSQKEDTGSECEAVRHPPLPQKTLQESPAPSIDEGRNEQASDFCSAVVEPKAKVADSFFDEDDNDDEPQKETPPPPQVVEPSNDDGDDSGSEHVASHRRHDTTTTARRFGGGISRHDRGARQEASTAPPASGQVKAAPALAIDISALMAQMSAIAVPTSEGDELSKRDKKDRRDKKEKREHKSKRDKKDKKSSKKRGSSDEEESDDGGFVVES